MKYATEAERKAARAASNKKYRASRKGKANHAKYAGSSKGLTAGKKYYRDRLQTRQGRALDRLETIRKRCRKKGLEYDLTLEWFLERDSNCALSGLPFEVGTKYHPMGLSVDKIDPDGGYVQSNCRLILYALNMFKGTTTDDTIFKIMKATLKFQED